MTQSAIMMKDQLAEIVSQRSRVWEDYDIAVTCEGELTTLSRRLTDSGPTDIVANLIPNASPPDELQRTVTAIKNEFEKLAHTEREISARQADIKTIKSNIKTGYTWLIVLVIISVVVIVIWLSQMLSHNPARVLSAEQITVGNHCFNELRVGRDASISIFFETDASASLI